MAEFPVSEVYRMKDADGNEYDVPEADMKEFSAAVPQASRVTRYRDGDGQEYDVPESDTEEFKGVVPGASPVHRLRFKSDEMDTELVADERQLSKFFDDTHFGEEGKKTGAGTDAAWESAGFPEIDKSKRVGGLAIPHTEGQLLSGLLQSDRYRGILSERAQREISQMGGEAGGEGESPSAQGDEAEAIREILNKEVKGPVQYEYPVDDDTSVSRGHLPIKDAKGEPLGVFERMYLQDIASKGADEGVLEFIARRLPVIGSFIEADDHRVNYVISGLANGRYTNPMEMAKVAHTIGVPDDVIRSVNEKIDAGPRETRSERAQELWKQAIADMYNEYVGQKQRAMDTLNGHETSAFEEITSGAIGLPKVVTEMTPLGMALTGPVNALNRSASLMERGDDEGTALVKGVVGEAAELLIWNKLNKIMKLIPGAKSAEQAFARTAVGESVIGKNAVQLLDMNVKSGLTELVDDVFGANKSSEEERKEFTEWAGEFLSVPGNAKKMLMMLPAHLILKGTGRLKQFSTAEGRESAREMKRIRSFVREFIGPEDSHGLSDNDAVMLYRLISSPNFSEESVRRFVSTIEGDAGKRNMANAAKAAGGKARVIEATLNPKPEKAPEAPESRESKPVEPSAGQGTGDGTPETPKPPEGGESRSVTSVRVGDVKPGESFTYEGKELYKNEKGEIVEVDVGKDGERVERPTKRHFTGEELVDIPDAEASAEVKPVEPSTGGGEEAHAPVLSGDEVRKTMPGYDPKNWKTHVDRNGYVAPRMEKQFQELLSTRKGKGNGEVIFLAGGNGSGKSTLVSGLGSTPDFIIDSTLGNLKTAKKQIDAVLANGQKPVIDYVYRAPEEALEGVIERVENGGHVVSPLSFADSHTKGIKNLRLLADEYGDKISIHVIDNSAEGSPEITLEQLEAKGIPDHAEIRKRANEVLGQYGTLVGDGGTKGTSGSGGEVKGAEAQKGDGKAGTDRDQGRADGREAQGEGGGADKGAVAVDRTGVPDWLDDDGVAEIFKAQNFNDGWGSAVSAFFRHRVRTDERLAELRRQFAAETDEAKRKKLNSQYKKRINELWEHQGEVQPQDEMRDAINAIQKREGSAARANGQAQGPDGKHMTDAARKRASDVKELTGSDFDETSLSDKELMRFRKLYQDYSKGGDEAKVSAAAEALKKLVAEHEQKIKDLSVESTKAVRVKDGAANAKRFNEGDKVSFIEELATMARRRNVSRVDATIAITPTKQRPDKVMVSDGKQRWVVDADLLKTPEEMDAFLAGRKNAAEGPKPEVTAETPAEAPAKPAEAPAPEAAPAGEAPKKDLKTAVRELEKLRDRRASLKGTQFTGEDAQKNREENEMSIAELDRRIEAAEAGLDDLREPSKPIPPAENLKPNPKKAAKVVADFASKDDTRNTLKAPYHDKKNGVVVATDGRILIATKHGFDPNAKEPEEGYPNWTHVVPDEKNLTVSIKVNPAELQKVCKDAIRLSRAVGIKDDGQHNTTPNVVLRHGDGTYTILSAEYLLTVAKAMEANGLTELRAAPTKKGTIGHTPLMARNADTTILIMPLRGGSYESVGRVSSNLVFDGMTGRIIRAPERTDMGVMRDTKMSEEWLTTLRESVARERKRAEAEARNLDIFEVITGAWKNGEKDPRVAYKRFNSETDFDSLTPENQKAFAELLNAGSEEELARQIAEYVARKMPDAAANLWVDKDPKQIAKIEKRIAAEDEVESRLMRDDEARALFGLEPRKKSPAQDAFMKDVEEGERLEREAAEAVENIEKVEAEVGGLISKHLLAQGTAKNNAAGREMKAKAKSALVDRLASLTDEEFDDVKHSFKQIMKENGEDMDKVGEIQAIFNAETAKRNAKSAKKPKAEEPAKPVEEKPAPAEDKRTLRELAEESVSMLRDEKFDEHEAVRGAFREKLKTATDAELKELHAEMKKKADKSSGEEKLRYTGIASELNHEINSRFAGKGKGKKPNESGEEKIIGQTRDGESVRIVQNGRVYEVELPDVKFPKTFTRATSKADWEAKMKEMGELQRELKAKAPFHSVINPKTGKYYANDSEIARRRQREIAAYNEAVQRAANQAMEQIGEYDESWDSVKRSPRAQETQEAWDEGKQNLSSSPNAKVVKSGKSQSDSIVYSPPDGTTPFRVNKKSISHGIRGVDPSDNVTVGRHIGEALDASQELPEHTADARYRMAAVKIGGADAHVLFTIEKRSGTVTQIDVLKSLNTKRAAQKGSTLTSTNSGMGARPFETAKESIAELESAWKSQFRDGIEAHNKARGRDATFIRDGEPAKMPAMSEATRKELAKVRTELDGESGDNVVPEWMDKLTDAEAKEYIDLIKKAHADPSMDDARIDWEVKKQAEIEQREAGEPERLKVNGRPHALSTMHGNGNSSSLDTIKNRAEKGVLPDSIMEMPEGIGISRPGRFGAKDPAVLFHYAEDGDSIGHPLFGDTKEIMSWVREQGLDRKSVKVTQEDSAGSTEKPVREGGKDETRPVPTRHDSGRYSESRQEGSVPQDESAGKPVPETPAAPPTKDAVMAAAKRLGTTAFMDEASLRRELAETRRRGNDPRVKQRIADIETMLADREAKKPVNRMARALADSVAANGAGDRTALAHAKDEGVAAQEALKNDIANGVPFPTEAEVEAAAKQLPENLRKAFVDNMAQWRKYADEVRETPSIGDEAKKLADEVDAEIDAEEADGGGGNPAAPVNAPRGRGTGALSQDEPKSLGAGTDKKVVTPQTFLREAKSLFPDLAFRRKSTVRMPKWAAGHFEPANNLLRARDVNSIRTCTHELGHFLEHLTRYDVPKLPAVKRDLSDLGHALYGPGGPKPPSYIGEGFAEYVRGYVCNEPNLATVAPDLHAWFNGAFKAKHPEIVKKLDRLRDMVQTMKEQSASQLVGEFMHPSTGAIQRAWKRTLDFFSGENWNDSATTILRGMKKSGIASLYRWQEDFRRLEETQDPAERARLAAEISDKIENHPYIFATVTRGTSSQRVMDMARHGTTSLLGNRRTGESMKEIFADFTPAEREDWKKYAIARHGIENYFNKQMDFGIPRDVLEEVVRQYDSPKFQQALQRFTDYSHRILHLGVDAGLISQETYDKIVADHPIYVRITRRYNQDGAGTRQGGQAINRRTGGFDHILDPIDAALMDQEKYLRACFQAKTLQLIIRAGERARAENIASIQRNGGPNSNNTNPQGEAHNAVGAYWPVKVPNAQEKVSFSSGKLGEQLRQAAKDYANTTGADPIPLEKFVKDLTQDNASLLTIFREKPSFGKHNLVSVYVDGQLQTYELPDMKWANMLTDVYDKSDFSKLEKTFGLATAGIRLGATTINPGFAVRNGIRDSLHSAIMSESGALPGLGSLNGMLQQLLGREAAAMFRSMGGHMSDLVGVTKEQKWNHGGKVALAQNALETIGAYSATDWALMKPVIKACSDLLSYPELGPRIREMSGVLSKCREAGLSEDAAAILAMSHAKDISIDFQRAGRLMKRINHFIPFSNAMWRGTEQTLRNLGFLNALPHQFEDRNLARAGKTIGRGLAFVTSWVLTLAMLEMSGDEKERRAAFERSPTEKWEYEHVGDWRFPLPFELGFIFGAIPKAAVYEMNGDEGAMKECLAAFNQAMPSKYASPDTAVGSISLFTPWIGLMRNQDYRGRPIVPQHIMENRVKEDWYTQYTTELSKKIGGFIGASPAQLEYLLDSYTGGLYRRTAVAVENIGDTSRMQEGRGFSMFDTLRARPQANRLVEDFYRFGEEAKRKFGSGQITLEEYGKMSSQNGVKKQLSEKFDEMRAIRADKSIPLAEQDRRVNEVAEKANDIVRAFNSREDYRQRGVAYAASALTNSEVTSLDPETKEKYLGLLKGVPKDEIVQALMAFGGELVPVKVRGVESLHPRWSANNINQRVGRLLMLLQD